MAVELTPPADSAPVTGPAVHLDLPAIARLRADLAAAHFTEAALDGLWGPDAADALRRNERLPALRALAALRARHGAPSALATLAELFLLGVRVPASEAAAALPGLGVDGATLLGLLGPASADPGAEPSLRALLELRPYAFTDSRGHASWWIASDLGELARGGPLGEDHVLGVGGASRTLSALMLQNAVDSVLDLGTGCGIQAMHAARHASRVVATDISQRALELAAFNAALNEIESIEFRLGSLFEPVAGERFDHVISNPPFVITPRVEGVPSYEYRDGGMVGDALVETVMREAAAHLTAGGVLQMLGNWEYTAQTPEAFDRLRGWLAPDIDYWIVEREVQSATRYAETWIRDGGTRSGTPEFEQLFAAWLDDFADRGVTQVGFGYVLLRVPGSDSPLVESSPLDEPSPLVESSPLVEASPLVEPVETPTLARLERLHTPLGDNEWGLGVHLGNCLAAHDWHAGQSDEEFAQACLTVSGDVTEERHYWPGHEDPSELLLRQGGGFARSIAPGTALAALVGASDGSLSVGAIAGALAQLLEVDEAALRAELLGGARRLLDDGILLPPEA
ncbi:DUF7059 domain-containing protein [Microterricola viridarii]|uniref:SAM-dependent methyltransferase n=1 Tax=Microterricola viridarii TaxID=412690 RepID=A0A0X8E356_9MICO|nr:methyltransferase [Microterricola viridarii]AMB59213.1 SAM-dependent methyltransferase [Microterricola viridarii]